MTHRHGNFIQGSIQCSAPYLPHHSWVNVAERNYDFGSRVTVTCNTTNEAFNLQCHNKGLWSGPVVVCPEPAAPVSAPTGCNAPALPPFSSVHNLALSYKNGDNINVTCNEDTDWFNLTCRNGTWMGQNIVCSAPVVECNPPIIPSASSIRAGKSRYKVGDQVNITCNDDPDWFVWECSNDGMWRGEPIMCSPIRPAPNDENPGAPAPIINQVNGTSKREFFITGLLVTAVILFIVVLMSLAMFFIFVRNRGYGLVSSSKEEINGKGERGPLPEVPEGYANYVAGEQSLYVEPYLKQNGDPSPSYEVYEKPV
ncbi:complement C2-like [Lytechinus pictus]|uniref:complement C2-like n=1 Tax=Lytechinus pictus TaxID=7653 RepID=UPI0030B9AE35